MSAELRSLLRAIDDAFERKTWHGPNLRGSIRGVSAAVAARRPRRGRHSIQELVVHAAYWKYAVRRRLLGEKRGRFALSGSNWFARPGPGSEKAWRQDVALLVAEHRQLVAAAQGLDAGRLHERIPGRRVSYALMLRGIAFHDVYHAGQIQLLKRLLRG